MRIEISDEAQQDLIDGAALIRPTIANPESVVHAVLDCRRDPAGIRKRFQ